MEPAQINYRNVSVNTIGLSKLQRRKRNRRMNRERQNRRMMDETSSQRHMTDANENGCSQLEPALKKPRFASKDDVFFTVQKMAVVPKEYPACKMTETEFGFLKATLLRRILESNGNNPPHFLSCQFLNGCMQIKCANTSTKTWLEFNFGDFNEDRWLLIPEEYLPRPALISLWASGIEEWSTSQILKMLACQNPRLDASEWIVKYEKKVPKTGVYLTAEVDKESVDTLSVLNYRPFVGLSQAKCKIIRKFKPMQQPIMQQSNAMARVTQQPMESLKLEFVSEASNAKPDDLAKSSHSSFSIHLLKFMENKDTQEEILENSELH